MNFLPLLAPASAFVVVFLGMRARDPKADRRLTLVRCAILLGAYHSLALDGLSLGRWVTQPGLLAAWAIVFLAGLVWYRRSGVQDADPIGLQNLRRLSIYEKTILGLIGTIALATAVVGWRTPPQTWDSLTYHVSRAAHWVQAGSLAHYPSGILRQISMPPGGETGLASLMLLSGGDQLLSLHQWLPMLGTVLAVSLIAKQIGANRSGQLVAALFAASLPIGIVEASSTINDYVATFWTVCACVEALEFSQTAEAKDLVGAALSAGLAILTKPTVAPVLLLTALVLAIAVWRRFRLGAGLRWGIAGVVLVLILNAGYLSRNLATFGAMSNPVDFSTHWNGLITPAGVVSSVLKQAGLQAGLPVRFSEYNLALEEFIRKAHAKLQVRLMDPRTTGDGTFKIRAPGREEDTTSNPYHSYLGVVALLGTMLFPRRMGWPVVVLAIGTAASFVIFSALFKWHVFSVRYHLVFFALLAPVVGRVASGGAVRDRAGFAIAVLLWAGSLPWLTAIESRPLLASWLPTRMSSVLTMPRMDLAFANAESLKPLYDEFATAIEEAACQDVGLMIGGDDAEYLWWARLGAPWSGVRIEWIVAGPTARYEDPGFAPCAVVCHHCPEDWSAIRGVPVFKTREGWVLFLQDAHTPGSE